MFVPGKLFQPSLMFVGEYRSLPLSGAPERCLTRVGSGLTRKNLTRLERLARDKHPSLLRKSVNYDHKKFYSTGSRMLRQFPYHWRHDIQHNDTQHKRPDLRHLAVVILGINDTQHNSHLLLS